MEHVPWIGASVRSARASRCSYVHDHLLRGFRLEAPAGRRPSIDVVATHSREAPPAPVLNLTARSSDHWGSRRATMACLPARRLLGREDECGNGPGVRHHPALRQVLRTLDPGTARQADRTRVHVCRGARLTRELCRFLEHEGYENLWYALTVRGHQVNGGVGGYHVHSAPVPRPRRSSMELPGSSGGGYREPSLLSPGKGGLLQSHSLHHAHGSVAARASWKSSRNRFNRPTVVLSGKEVPCTKLGVPGVTGRPDSLPKLPYHLQIKCRGQLLLQ